MSDLSQPLVALPSQLLKHWLHAMLHVPEEQVGVPFIEEQMLSHLRSFPRRLRCRCSFRSRMYFGRDMRLLWSI